MDINHNEESSTEEFSTGFAWGDVEITEEMEDVFLGLNKMI